MITISEKEKCCGCNACVQACPQKCIQQIPDAEGFLYPQANRNKCVDCGLCETVCPLINCTESKSPIKVLAAQNKNENIRQNSSSGGLFTALAQFIIKEKKGVVFGARFDRQWNVVHDYTETIEGIKDFQRSKYVQSIIGGNYLKAKQFLQQGRWVLFTGTHCQIAGLKTFLRKDYERLLAVDVFCHGVPSNKTWQQYLDELKNYNKSDNIVDINFRSKKEEGWGRYHVNVDFENKHISQLYRKNPYQRGFIKNLYLRPSCYQCALKKSNSEADISLGDYWGIGDFVPSMDDDRGTSMVVVYSSKAETILSELNLNIKKIESEDAPIIWKSALINDKRSSFFESNTSSFQEIVTTLCKGSKKEIIVETISDFLIFLLGFKLRKKIKKIIKF